MKPKLIGYVGTKDLAVVSKEDARAMDRINIAFGHVVDGECVWRDGEAEDIAQAMQRIRLYHPEIELVLSVGGWGAGGFSEMASTAKGREHFAKTAAELALRHDLDGLDIDWEYPCIAMAGIDASTEDRANFTYLLEALRQALDQLPNREGRCPYRLTIAGGGDSYFCRNTDFQACEGFLDDVLLMSYDLRGGYTCATGHHTNLGQPRNDFSEASVKKGVRDYLEAGVPRDKLIIGAAFYSRLWRGVPPAQGGYNQFAETLGGYGPSYDELVEGVLNDPQYTRYWDAEAEAPWLYGDETFISYDDPESLRAKVRYLKEENLAGIMFWEYGLARRHPLVPFCVTLDEA